MVFLLKRIRADRRGAPSSSAGRIPTRKGLTAWPCGSGKVLDSVNCGTADGTIVRQWAQLDNTGQQWDIAP